MKALIPQGLIGRPNYFGLLNNSMTLIICKSLRQIGEMACVTSAWSSRGQTLKSKRSSKLLGYSLFTLFKIKQKTGNNAMPSECNIVDTQAASFRPCYYLIKQIIFIDISFLCYLHSMTCLLNSSIFRAAFQLNGLLTKRCCMERTPPRAICK